MFAANCIKRHNMKSSKDMMAWLLQQNEILKQKYDKDSNLRNSVNEQAWKKAKKNDFYLGLESSWLYTWFE